MPDGCYACGTVNENTRMARAGDTPYCSSACYHAVQDAPAGTITRGMRAPLPPVEGGT